MAALPAPRGNSEGRREEDYPISYVLSEIGKANFWASAIDAYRKLVAKAG